MFLKKNNTMYSYMFHQPITNEITFLNSQKHIPETYFSLTFQHDVVK